MLLLDFASLFVDSLLSFKFTVFPQQEPLSKKQKLLAALDWDEEEVIPVLFARLLTRLTDKIKRWTSSWPGNLNLRHKLGFGNGGRFLFLKNFFIFNTNESPE